MAQDILNDVLNFKIPPKEIMDWLTSENIHETKWSNFDKDCSREEFVTFFLNYLRDQFASVFQDGNASKQTPAKNILSQPVIKALASTNSNQELPGKSQNLISNITKSETEKSAGVQSVLNININSPISSPQTSTPLVKKNNSMQKKRVELISSSPSVGRNINPAFMPNDSFEYERVINTADSRNISFDNNPFPSLGGKNSSSLNTSNVSTNINKSEPSDLIHSNLSQKLNMSTSNRILQSPVSPLYTNSISMLSPINVKTSHNKYIESPSSNNYFQHNISSTPDRASNSFSKNSKTTPRQSLSLGDFIVTETRSSKKGKKNNSRMSKSGEQKDLSQERCQGLPGASCTNSEQNTRRRKVNPTRLNVTDEKESKENTVFGVVTRPLTQNPQFVNVSPIEKSVDNESFEVERGLVKMERSKNPETTKNKNVNKINKTDQSKQKICPQTPIKILHSGSVVVPNKELVENAEALDALAELYSDFLDHNLVVNPMTELYFIIHLITVQYKNKNKQLSSAIKNKSEKIQDNAKVNDNASDVKNNISILRKCLTYEEGNLDENVKLGNDNILLNEPLEGLGCSDLAGDVKENLNQINKKLKQISVSETSEEKTNDIRRNSIKELDVTENCVKMYLDTAHNCVYFSTQVLNHQKTFLKCLDRVTLKLLCENSQIATFQPELCKYLDTIYSNKVAQSNKTKFLRSIGTVELNVCFQIDTDNREQFPSAVAFTCFRKQRDIFYEILKIWEDKHSVSDWKFQIALGGKIKTMLSMHMDVCNITHLTRLFKSQMLISCTQSGQQEDELDDKTASFLKNLKDINPKKLNQLKKKLVTPLSQNGPVPLPSFPGIQEFYKDFILSASCPKFYTYLEDTFIKEIMELNDSQFTGSDIEETETEVDESTKENFVMCLSSLRLLSKFLGFLTSLPYRSETSMLDDVITCQVNLRSKCLPRIDLQYCLQSAVIQGKLSLTVPWVVEYLAMLDHASLRLPYYKKVLEMLYCIYRASKYHTVMKSDELMSQRTAVLVKLAIGWLFELPVFPRELYYLWQSRYNNKALKIIGEQSSAKTDFNFTDNETSVASTKHCLFLDKLEMVDDRILYNCCPFLRELNILLTPGNSSVNNCTSYRHVTPVTSQLDKQNKKANTKHLEIQLEEAFFHSQPMSTRKTVEYVSERVASSCVKYICNNFLPVERKRNHEDLKSIVNEKYKHEKNQTTIKNLLLKDMNMLSARASKNIKEKSKETIIKICESRITQSIEALLAEDCLKPVKDMCTKIAVRMAMERINQWIQSHIVGSSHFMKDMECELNKAFKETSEPISDKQYRNLNVMSAKDAIANMRMIIWNLLEARATVKLNDVSNFWDQLYESVIEYSQLQCPCENIILTLSIDLCLFLITFRGDLFTNEIQAKVCEIWKIDYLNISDPDSPLSRILSPRNIMIMTQPADKNVWLHCGRFLSKLLKEDILTIEDLNKQAVSLFRTEWPMSIMKALSTCLKEAIENYRSSNEETERIRCLVEWIAGACNDMDQDSFCFD